MRQQSRVSRHDVFWYGYFEEDRDSEVVAERIQSLAARSRFSRPDWNTLLTPLVVEQADLLRLSEALAGLRRAMATSARLLYGNDDEAFALAAGFPAAACAALRLRSAGLLPARWDVLETVQGWQTVELNAGGALGVFAFDAVQRIYDDILAGRGLAGTESWSSLAAAIGRDMAALAHKHGTSRAAVVVDRVTAGVYGPIATVVAHSLSDALGLDVPVCDEGQAAARAGERAAPLLAYQCCSIADRAVSPSRYAAYDAAVEAGGIVQAVDPMADVLASKSVMAMAWRCVEEGRLPQEQAALVRALLPYTSLLTDAVRRRAEAERPDWVLKTAFGHGGYEVRCGWELDEEAWSAALAAAAEPGAPLAIVQRRVRGIDREGIGMTPDGTVVHMSAPKLLGLFQLGDELCGACARQSPHNGGVVSVGAGAALGVVRGIPAGAPADGPGYSALASEGAA